MSSNTNFVQLKLALAATAAQTTLTVMVPSAPFQLPAINGTLTLLDVPAAPTKAEIIGYTTVTNNGDGTATLGGVTRGKEGTTAQTWAPNSFLFQSLTAGDYATDLAGKQSAHANLSAMAGLAGAADKLPYFTGAGALSLATLTAAARTLLEAADAAGQRSALGLGTAATATVTSAPYDNTAGRLLKVGDFGLGASPSWGGYDANTLGQSGNYPCGPTSANLPSGSQYGVLEVHGSPDASYLAQTYYPVSALPAPAWYRRRVAGTWSPWARNQQQQDAIAGQSYVECLNIIDVGVFSSLTIYTNIPAAEGVMWTVKIEGAAGSYVDPVSAIIAGYFYEGAIFSPTMTVQASNTAAFTSATVGVVSGKVAIRIAGIGYIPRLAVSAIRKISGAYTATESAYEGWGYALDTGGVPAAVVAKVMRAPMLGGNSVLYNLPFTGTNGSYEHAVLTYVSGSLQFGVLNGSYWYLKTGADQFANLGTPAYRWATLYAASGTINTSDARRKTPVQPLTTAELAVAKQLAGEIGTFQWLQSVEEKGAAARHHVGVTVQRVMEVFAAHGLDPFRYGLVCYDQWADEVKHHPEEVVPTQVPAVLDADGNVLEAEYTRYEVIPARDEVTREAGDIYSLRMDQLALFLARGQAQRQDELEARIVALEAAT